jgi:hypothetical protein
VESGLSRLNDESAALDSINAAVRRLTEHVIRQQRVGSTVTDLSKRHREARLLGKYPFELTPAEVDTDNSSREPLTGVVGYTRQISSTAISFDHVEPLNARIVLATFKLNGGERLSFVVDVIWTEKTPDGFVSGGTMLAVGVPAQEEPLSV